MATCDNCGDGFSLDDFLIEELVDEIERRTRKTIDFSDPPKSLMDIQKDELFEEARDRFTIAELTERLKP